MKKLLYKFCAFALILTANHAIAGIPEGDFHKEKSVNKVYLVNADAGIDIRNKYGNIYVATWDEDKIAIDVLIKVSGKNEDAVNKRLNSINIELNALTSLVSAKTVIASNWGKNVNMEINYTIKIPRRGGVTLSNQYGAIITDKIQGKSYIDCKYGSISIAELQNADNNVRIQYCDHSTVGYIKNGIIDAKYSTLSVAKSGNLTLSSDYTDTNIKEVGNITYKANYGDLFIANADNVSGTGDYLTLKFGNIRKNLSINTDYSAIEISKISARANNIEVVSTYTNVNIKCDAEYAFDFEFNLRYAGLQASDLTFQIKRESASSSFYKGFYKNSGSNRMSITANYGNLKLTRI